jgi:quercetin dioxygenase-like cupin family protein
MIFDRIENFKNGWFIGDFSPSLLKTKSFEVASQTHTKGFVGVSHYHKKSTEYNLVVSGKVKICGKEMVKGDIFVFLPDEISTSEFIEDTTIIVVRTPSDPTDKHII